MAKPKKTAQGTYRIQFESAGERHSGTFDTAREANAFQAVTLAASKQSAAAGIKGYGMTLRDALRKFAEEESPKRRGERWEIVRLTAFEKAEHALPVGKLLAKFDEYDLKAWRDRRLISTSRGTVLRDMTLLSSVLETARVEWRWITLNPIRDVKKPSSPAHRQRVIYPGEIRGMLRALGYQRKGVASVSQAVATCFLLALATGMRAGELCGLRWADVMPTYVTAHDVKSKQKGVSRSVPLSPVAQRLVERIRGWDDVNVVGVAAATLDALFRRARKRAGLNGFTFHDSRHSAATRIALSGKWTVLELCKAMGWRNPAMAMIYFNPTPTELAAKL